VTAAAAAATDGSCTRAASTSPSSTRKPDPELADRAVGDEAARVVSDLELDMRERPADRRALGPAQRIALKERSGDDVGLRRPVLVVERRAEIRAEGTQRRCQDHLLARGDELLQRPGATPAVVDLGELLEARPGREQALDLGASDEVQHRVGIVLTLGRHQDQLAARGPRREHLLERHVEPERRELERPRRPSRAPDLPLDQVAEGPLRHRHAFRPTGRA
jgi:hypothetical protein